MDREVFEVILDQVYEGEGEGEGEGEATTAALGVYAAWAVAQSEVDVEGGEVRGCSGRGVGKTQ